MVGKAGNRHTPHDPFSNIDLEKGAGVCLLFLYKKDLAQLLAVKVIGFKLVLLAYILVVVVFVWRNISIIERIRLLVDLDGRMDKRKRLQPLRHNRTIHTRLVDWRVFAHQYLALPCHRIEAQPAQVHDHTRPDVFGINCPPLAPHHTYRSNAQRSVEIAQISPQRCAFPFGLFHGWNRPFLYQDNNKLFPLSQ